MPVLRGTHAGETEHVYIGLFGDLVKIGRSKTPHARLRAIASSCGQGIVDKWVSPALKDSAATERKLHVAFDSCRLKGEFFSAPFNTVVAQAEPVCASCLETEDSAKAKSDARKKKDERMEKAVDYMLGRFYGAEAQKTTPLAADTPATLALRDQQARLRIARLLKCPESCASQIATQCAERLTNYLVMKNSASTTPCCDVFLGTILAYSRYKDLGLHECNGAMESFEEYTAEMADDLGVHTAEIVNENGILYPTYPLEFLDDAYVAWLAEDKGMMELEDAQ